MMRSRKMSVILALGLGLSLAFFWLVGAGLPDVVRAASFTVDTTTDEYDGSCFDGDCSLRDAIIEANDNAEDDTIYLGVDVYTLTLMGFGDGGGDLDVWNDDGHALTIVGQGLDQTVIDANGLDRVLDIHFGAKVTLQDVSIINGDPDGNGGGIYVYEADLDLDNVVVSTNTAEYGGGVFVHAGHVSMSGGEIRSNTAIIDGGGVYVDASDASFTQDSAGVIAGNVSTGFGGGIFVYDGDAALSGQVLDNDADDGGGVYIFSGTVTLDRGQILSNVAANGAGVYINRSEAVFTQTGTTSAIAHNSVSIGKGGGVHIAEGHMTLDGGQIFDNDVPDDEQGGGVYVEESTASFVQNAGSQIVSNSAGYGGGLLVVYGQATLNGGEIVSNTAVVDGGGVYVDYADASLIQHSSHAIAYNEAIEDGGGVYVYAGQAAVNGGRIYDNVADDGGGIFVHDAGASVSSDGGQVVGNTAERGGGLYIRAGFLTLTNTTVSGNGAGSTGGALHSQGGTTEMTNATVVSSTAGGGLQVEGGMVAVQNTIIAHHSGAPNCNVLTGATLTSNGHNLEDVDTCGFSETSDQPNTNPLLGPLADNGGDTWTHALLFDSPAIDAGACVAGVTTDQRGTLRPQGAGCDIGAYEAGLDVFLRKTVDDETPGPGQRITYTIVVENNGESGITDGVVSDTLSSSLNFVGPVTLDPASAGTTDDPPTLVSGLTLAAGDSVTVTFAVTVDTGLPAGTTIDNIAALTSAEVVTPQTDEVEVTVSNVAPVADDATFTTNEHTSIQRVLPADDANGDDLTFGLLTTPVSGTLVLDDDTSGTFTYTPTVSADDYDAVFSYIVTDTGGLGGTGTITVSVRVGNDPPVAHDEDASTDEDTIITGTLAVYDLDPDEIFTYTVSTDPIYGQASIGASTGMWTYTPTNRMSDYTDAFTVTVTDSGDNTDTATITVDVTADNDPPTAYNASVSITSDVKATGVVSFTDPDTDESSWTFSVVEGPENGFVAINSRTGAWEYEPDPDVAQDYTDAFTVRVTDSDDNTDTATITVEVTWVAQVEEIHFIYLPLVANGD
jgi:uncharacterized repeat protein (TIGR01451 family)/CSLREA domain-containing protein